MAYEIVRSATDAELENISLLADVEEDGERRAAYVNIADGLVEYEFLKPLFDGGRADRVMDGMIEEKDGRLTIVTRFHDANSSEPIASSQFEFEPSGVFQVLHKIALNLAEQSGVTLPEALQKEVGVGTENGESFLLFLEGLDSLNYVQQTQGMVAREFSPDRAFDALVESARKDPDFLAPYEVLCAFARTCGALRLGTFEKVEEALKNATEIAPADFRAWYALGELYHAVGMFDRSCDAYEKAKSLHEATRAEAEAESQVEDWHLEQASIFSRLGVSQAAAGMRVNAELNFRKAIELEGPDKPSLQLLSSVLAQTGRAHEVPPLWREQADADPTNGETRAKYALALLQVGQEKDAENEFEKALTLENTGFAKRVYAPYLAQQGEFDRAMDLYEDCLDESPADIALMLEYARCLQAGGREFEVLPVLENVLKANPDQNTIAETMAWKAELTEPKRVEAVKNAEQKLSDGDAAGAVKDLRPLRNWLADYWKLWALLAAASNRAEMYDDAIEAAERTLSLFPGCEPAYGEMMAAFTGKGMFEEAYNVMRHAAARIPGSLGIHLNLALAAKRSGREDEARAMAQQLREAVGQNSELEPVFAELEE